MLKLVGALLLLGGASLCGLSAAGRLGERLETLEGLENSLVLLEEELSFSLAPLPKVLERLSRSQKGAVAGFYKSVLAGLRDDPERGVRPHWQNAVEVHLVLLREEERQALRLLGDTLGRYDGDAQRQALRQTIGRLERFREAAREERSRLGRVYGTVGVAAGLLAVIVLI